MLQRLDCIVVGHDRDLLDPTAGASVHQESHHGGKSYEQLYGEQVEAICRYIRQEGAFGFLSNDEMEKLVYFFRFQAPGNSNLSPACILASYFGQMVFKIERVVFPPDVSQLICSFEDKDFYERIVERLVTINHHLLFGWER